MTRFIVALALLVTLSGVFTLGGQAQEGAAPATTAVDPGDGVATQVEHPYGGETWTFSLDPQQPLTLHVVDRGQNLAVTWVTSIPFARLPDGSVVALTPCDNLVVICVPVTTEATGALTDVNAGDALVLAPGKAD